MPDIKHILFPVDFSDRTNSALPFVAEMAHQQNAKITLMAIAKPHYESGIAGAPMIDPQLMLDGLKAELDTAFMSDFAGLRVDQVAVLGDPARAIREFVESNDVDLVMMPTHGYGPFRQLLLGSVTAKVLHDVAVPVWTNALGCGTSDRDHLVPHNILCAVDASQASVELMQWAEGLCKTLGANLRLVHAVPIEVFPGRPLEREFEDTLLENARRRIENLEKTAEIEVPICVSAGTVPDVVREEALEHKADLVLIGRGVMQETMGRLRTHCYGIIRHAPCPVLSV